MIFVSRHALAVFMLLALLPLAAQSAVVSTFDTGTEGWRVFGDAQGASAEPTWIATGGNPGGYLQATDNVSGGVWFWDAPAAFLGNQAGALGQTLSFDLAQSSLSSPFDADDIVLVGDGRTLAYDTPNNPGTDWTSYIIALVADGSWRVGSRNGVAATEAELLGTLGALNALRIRGEFRSGADTGRLDNVVLATVPLPGALWLLGSAVVALGLRGRRREEV